jgi:hypothetical protein
MRKAQEALMREVQSKLGSQGELRYVKTVMRKVEDFKTHSSTLESTVKDGYERLVQAFDLSRREMRDVEKRLNNWCTLKRRGLRRCPSVAPRRPPSRLTSATSVTLLLAPHYRSRALPRLK